MSGARAAPVSLLRAYDHADPLCRRYFGDQTAITESNAGAEPRIQLHSAFGEPRGGASVVSSSLSDLPAATIAKQLTGLAERYSGKTTVVTGGGRGIGEGCVRVFFEAGANVVIADRDLSGAQALADELNKCGANHKAHAVRTDVSITAELQQLVEATVERFGRIDCVINNAGWHPPHKPIDDFSPEDMQNLMQARHRLPTRARIHTSSRLAPPCAACNGA